MPGESGRRYDIQSGYSSYGVDSPETRNYADTEQTRYGNEIHANNLGNLSSGIESHSENRESSETGQYHTDQYRKTMELTKSGIDLATSLGLTAEFANAWKQREKEMQEDNEENKKYQGLSDESKKMQSFYEVAKKFGYEDVIKGNNQKAEEVGKKLIVFLKKLGKPQNAGASLAHFLDEFGDKRNEMEKSGSFFGLTVTDTMPDVERSYRSGSFLSNNSGSFSNNNGSFLNNDGSFLNNNSGPFLNKRDTDY